MVLSRSRTDGGISGGRFDLVGAVISTAVLVVFLLAITNGADLGWRSPPIAGGFAAAVVLAGFFTYWELRNRSPMLDVALFRHRVFTIGVAASMISFMGSSSVRFLMPFYLQAVLGYSPGRVGLVLMPAAFAMIVTGPLGGRLSDRYGWTPFNVGGLLLSAAGLLISVEGDGGLARLAYRAGYSDPEHRDRDVQPSQQQLDPQCRGTRPVRGDVRAS